MRTTDLEVFLAKDPLGEASRKARRNLLLVGFISIVIAEANVIPKKIAVLGLEFSDPQQEVFLYTLAGLTIYFISQFSAYLLSDITQREIEAKKLFSDSATYDVDLKEKKRQAYLDAFVDGDLRIKAMRQYFWRGVVDVYFPYAFAVYVLFILWSALT